MSVESEPGWIRSARKLSAHGDYGAAAQACIRKLSEYPRKAAILAFADELAGNNAFPEQALAFAIHVLEASPASAWRHHILANAFIANNQYLDSLESSNAALALDADFADAHARKGQALLKLRSYAAALPSLTRAVALKPELAEAWAGMGRAFGKVQQHRLAMGAYRRALAVDPHYPFLKARLLQAMILSCDWKDMPALVEEIERDVAAGRKSARPFVWQAVSPSPRSLQLSAEIFTDAHAKEPMAQHPRSRTKTTRKIRIGYVSGELREHSTAYLRVGVFENHDKDAFEIIIFDNGWDDGGRTRARINHAGHRIITIGGLSDVEAATLIEQEEIDILVDLNGFNGFGRQGVLAMRPAPIQVTFPGYPGTLGSNYIDYIIADETIIPPEHRCFYAEQPVYMPDSYQANDRNRLISDRVFSRGELGLPEKGIIFCCFNNNYKIMPSMFDTWARILQAVPGSVLWLLADNAVAVANLREEASHRGLNAERLVFAERMEVSEHLARQRAADLFLDTLPCNAHATASDALWSGLPVLTCLGETFSGRVAASLLRAADLPELVAETVADYEQMAIHLATHPEELSRLKQHLAERRFELALFDTSRFTKNLEGAYREMHRRYGAGEPPSLIVVEKEPSVVQPTPA